MTEGPQFEEWKIEDGCLQFLFKDQGEGEEQNVTTDTAGWVKAYRNFWGHFANKASRIFAQHSNWTI